MTTAVEVGHRGIGTIAATAVQFAPILRATPETTDHDLVAAVRRGDDQAFECLYERYHRRIAAYIYGMVNDYGRAEDIAQDVFMSALRRMRETDRPIAFKPWVYEIAKNACIDQFRRSRRAEEVSYDAEDGMGASDYGRLVTTGPSPDAAVATKMSLDHLRSAFGGLSETHHQILVMRELEGLSYREIGERLGMSRPSVESTLFRARRRLGEEYDELVSGERCTRVQQIIGAAAEGSLGTRDQRKLAKHVAHCQSCRREARLAGIEAGLVATRTPGRTRIAALLPLPAFLRRRFEADDAGVGTSSLTLGHHAPAMAQWSAHLSSTVDPAIAGWAKAVVAAAAVAVAGVSGAISDDDGKLRNTLPGGVVTKQAQVRSSAEGARPASVRDPSTAAVSAATFGARDDDRRTHGNVSAPALADAQRERAGALSEAHSTPTAVPERIQAPPSDGEPPVSIGPVSGIPTTPSDPTNTPDPRPDSSQPDPIEVAVADVPAVEAPVSATLPGDSTQARDSIEGTVTGVVGATTESLTSIATP